LTAGANPGANINLCPPEWVAAANLPAGCPSGASPALPPYPYYPNLAGAATWNLIDGYLRVEYKNAGGAWVAVTNEWLGLGFARGLTPPTVAGANPINPNAILLLQEPADRNGNGAADTNSIAPSCKKTVSGVCTQWTNPMPP